MNDFFFGKIKPKGFLIFILYFLFPAHSKAQFERSLDSLYQLKTPIERSRGFLGSAEELKLEKEDYSRYMNAIEKLATDKKDRLLSDHIKHIKEAWKAYGKGTLAENITANQKLAEQYKKEGKMLFAGYCHHYLAQNYFSKQEYGLAFENYFLAYDIFKKIGFDNVPTISKFLHDFALSHYFFKDYKETIRLMNISAKHAPYNNIHHIQRYNNLAISYSNLGKRDSALYYFQKTKELGKRYNISSWEGITSGNIGDIYYKEKKYPEALKQYKVQYDILRKSIVDPARISSYLNMAKTYLALDSINQMEMFLDFVEKDLSNLRKNKSYGDDQQLQVSKRNYYDIKVKYFTKNHRFEDALKYKDSLAYSQNILDSKYNAAIVKMSSDKIVIQNKELELAHKEKEKVKQRFFYIFLILGVLILGGIGYFYLYMSKLKKKRQNERLISQNRISILEKQQAEKELETAQKEIHHFVSKVNEHNNIINRMENELIHLKNLELEQKNQIGETLRNLKLMKILTDDDWVDFQSNFEAVFPEFINALKSYLPIITASEMRYLMLTKLGLNNKEMARTLGVSESAVRITWSRLRKKMNLASEETPVVLMERMEVLGNTN